MNTQTHTDTATGTARKQDKFRDHVDNIKSDAVDLKDDIAGAAGAAGTELQHMARAGADKAAEVQSNFNDTIRSHPTASVLIAAGAGLVLGRLFAAVR